MRDVRLKLLKFRYPTKPKLAPSRPSMSQAAEDASSGVPLAAEYNDDDIVPCSQDQTDTDILKRKTSTLTNVSSPLGVTVMPEGEDEEWLELEMRKLNQGRDSVLNKNSLVQDDGSGSDVSLVANWMMSQRSKSDKGLPEKKVDPPMPRKTSSTKEDTIEIESTDEEMNGETSQTKKRKTDLAFSGEAALGNEKNGEIKDTELWERIVKGISTILPGEKFSGGYPEWTKNEDNWKRLSSLLQINVMKLKTLYFLTTHPILVPRAEELPFNEFQCKLVTRLKELRCTDWEAVDWDQLSGEFNDVGPVFVYFELRLLIKRFVPKEKWTNLRKCVKYLTKKAIPVLKAEKEIRYLKNVKL